jgi:hypothetical protein
MPDRDFTVLDQQMEQLFIGVALAFLGCTASRMAGAASLRQCWAHFRGAVGEPDGRRIALKRRRKFLDGHLWMKRLTGEGTPPNRLDAIIYDALGELEAARARMRGSSPTSPR